jgi:pimeloyl-ACP methyl ester carboxylesterase
MTLPPDLTLRAPDGTPYSAPLASYRFYAERVCRIILIHGFRNSETDALETYQTFRSHLDGISPFLSNKLFYLVWPGDHFGGNPIRYFDDNVQNALEAGRTLARFMHDLIADQASPCQFIIIAHSLGCRLAAEMMRELHRRNPAACHEFKLFLMAGALPTGDVLTDQASGTGLGVAGYVANLFSPDDRVLRILFPLGEIGGLRLGLEPIGLNGAPVDFGWSERAHMEGFGHGDYWKKMTATEFIARALGGTVATALPVNGPVHYQPPEHTP